MLAIAGFAAASGGLLAKVASKASPDVRPSSDRADDIRQLKIAVAREDSERAAILAAKKQRSPSTTRPITTEELRQQYAFELNREIRKRWNAKSAPPLVRCKVMFEQIPGGLVVRIEFVDCPYAEPARAALERALRLRELPYSGYESVFSRQVTLTLCVPELECTIGPSLR